MAKKKLLYVPQTLDLVIYAGDGPSFSLKVTDPDGIPIPLNGSIVAQIRTERDAPDPPAATFAVDWTNALTGSVVLSLTGAQTQALVTTEDKFTGVWDIQWTPSGEEPVTLCQGEVECMPDVSRT
jgi:hypothetical protein